MTLTTVENQAATHTPAQNPAETRETGGHWSPFAPVPDRDETPVEPAQVGDTAHRTPHSTQQLSETVSAGSDGSDDAEEPHTALNEDDEQPPEEEPPAVPAPSRRDQLVEWLRRECQAPVTWAERPAAPAEVLDYARTGAWAHPKGFIRGAGIAWQYVVSVPGTYLLYGLAWIIQRPGRTATFLLLSIVTGLAFWLG